MGNCDTLERNGLHLVAREFAAAFDSVSHFTGFAEGITDTAFFVTHDDEGREIKTTTALNDFGGAIDINHFFGQLFAAFKGVFRHIGRWTTTTTRPALIASATITATTTKSRIATTSSTRTSTSAGIRGRSRSSTFNFFVFSHIN